MPSMVHRRSDKLAVTKAEYLLAIITLTARDSRSPHEVGTTPSNGAHRIRQPRASSRTQGGVEKLYKLTLGLIALDIDQQWPSAAVMKANGHKLDDMHQEVIAELRQRTRSKSQYVRGALAIPLIAVPGWWTTIGHFLPLTDGVGSIHRTLFTDQPVTDPWGVCGLVWLVMVSLAYLAAGIAAFGFGQTIAKRRGTLGRY